MFLRETICLGLGLGLEETIKCTYTKNIKYFIFKLIFINLFSILIVYELFTGKL